jgi:murein DD-endopeptidase MepM/ murein hydrolase activator NlpD
VHCTRSQSATTRTAQKSLLRVADTFRTGNSQTGKLSTPTEVIHRFRDRSPHAVKARDAEYMTFLSALLTCALALTAPAATPQDDGRFTWPLTPTPQVTRAFQLPTTPYGPGHRGIDLAATPAQPVLAAAHGVVTFAATLAGRGVITIDHDGDLRTTYEPVTPTVTVGTQVHATQQIGTVDAGHPDCPAPACLHWGVRRADEYLNPLTLVATDTQIRLKPWTDPPNS